MTNKEIFYKAEMNLNFFEWLEEQDVTGNDMAALIWSCPSWDYLSGWFDKIEYWFDAPKVEGDELVEWYNSFDCEPYAEVIADLYRKFEEEN